MAALLGALGVLLALGAVLIANAAATPGCGPAQRTSPDGTVAYGSPCADEIVITSPLVEKVYAGEGDDVIYANAEVEEIYGGAGSDVIYGDLQQSEANSNSGTEYQPSYEPAPGAEAEGGASASSVKSSPLATASNRVDCSTSPCYGGDGSQEMFGGPGPDQIFGQRGNDTLHGEGGRDALNGGIGDDTAFGGTGYDLLAGGLGTDTLDGENDSDLVRGDGTVDVLKDSGASGSDVLSFATAVVPGFTGTIPIAGFPAEGNGEERGVYVRMDGAPAPCGTPSCNSDARYGGGGDEIKASGFEEVIGSPFADYMVGSDRNERFFGGGGADVMIGNGGSDGLFGGSDGDFASGGSGYDLAYGQAGTNNCAADVEFRSQCAGSAEAVNQRDRSKISVGYQTTFGVNGAYPWESFYLVGSGSADNVSVKYVNNATPPSYMIFTTEAGSAEFDTSGNVKPGVCSYTPSEVKCAVGYAESHVDAITLAGMAGDDRLSIAADGTEWEGITTPVLLGGQGNDVLIGSSQTEDVLVDGDGAGNDALYGFGFDDALLNNEGADNLQAGVGSDLLLSATTCGGDVLQGAENKKGDEGDVNNASWAALPWASGGVVADLKKGTAGSQYTEVIITAQTKKGGGKKKGGSHKSGKPSCASGAVDHLYNIDDIEASSQSDALYGDARSNNLLGRNGEDVLYGRGGDDRIAAKDGEADKVGGGRGENTCAYDEGLDTVEDCAP